MSAHPAPEFLTVRELAELLRIKERKVYDLAASGEIPVSRATGKLLFPADDVRAWIHGARSGPPPQDTCRPEVFLGSHDPLLDWALRQSLSGLASYFDGSHDGLRRFRAGEGVATGLHIYDGAGWNRGIVERECAGHGAVLVHWARRRRGLVVHADEAGIKGLSDLRGRRFAPRQSESGTDTLFRHLLSQSGVALADLTLAETARSEQDAVLAVAGGRADATFGLEAISDQYGLTFIPLIEEEFALLIDRHGWFEPPLQRLMAFCQSPSFADHAKGLAGYDISDLGRVVWNG